MDMGQTAKAWQEIRIIMTLRFQGAALPKLGRVVFICILLFSFAGGAYAATSENVQYVEYYIGWRNEYRLDYWGYPSNVTGVQVRFENAQEEVWTKDYGSEGLTGIYYLTCNGIYDYYFKNSSGQVVAKITGIVTSAIVNGSCNSYPDGMVIDGLGVTATPNGDGTFTLGWNDIGASGGYEIWKDGQLIDTVTTPPIIADPGSYVVRGVDGNGNTIAESDITIQPDESGCDVCKKLSDLLECPDWDKYMGELTGAIRNALPTLPEWRNIANQFVNAFSDYFGEVPEPPSVGDISQRIIPDLPVLDTNVPGSDVKPVMPTEYNQPIDFDITTGPEIEIVDESKPIEIFEPNRYIDSDGPGVMVFPGDPRNSSNGIKQPDTIQTPYPTPIPTKESDYDTPPADVPIPSDPPEGLIPMPREFIGEVPIPNM